MAFPLLSFQVANFILRDRRLAGESENLDEQIISLEHLEELEKIYVERIRDISTRESILDMHNFLIAFFLWERLDQEGVTDYLDALLINDVNKLKFICAMAGRWYGTHGRGWGFHSKNFSKYISPDEVFDMIQNFDKNQLEVFSELEQIKLASFVLNYHQSDMEYVNEQEAEKLVESWKSGSED